MEEESRCFLASPPWYIQQAYYDALTAGSAVQVRQVQAVGKGAFATRSIEAGEVVLNEPPLVGVQHTHNKGEAIVCAFCFCYIGSIRLQIKIKLEASTSPCCDHDEDENGDVPVPPPQVLALLADETYRLPHEEVFPLPEVVRCSGGCSERYCSKSCAAAAWAAHHSLLCVGSGLCRKRDALIQFKHFSDETNDIFHVASQVIANVMLRARGLAGTGRVGTGHLLEAWKPFAVGYKRLWWDSVAVPEDVDPQEEEAFRQQIRELASESLRLLKEALCEEEYAPLFSLQVYGSIIGMFELNNLEIVVASPVEDYFLYIDDLEPAPKAGAKALLDALGSRYATFCQGTGFFAIQSCLNHSCEPNAKAFKRDEDKNGNAVIVATRNIVQGEQIFISYISEDASYMERQALLADYGFRCECGKCRREAAEQGVLSSGKPDSAVLDI